MGGIVKSVFGGGGGGPSVNPNTKYQFGKSTLQKGKLNVDPRFYGLRNQYLSGVQGLQDLSGALSPFASRYNQLGQEFAGNQGALIAARVSPLRQSIAERGGELRRDLGRRNVFGSFANQDINRFETDAARALGEAQALATADALQARTQLTGLEQGATQADVQNQVLLNQLLGGASQEVLTQELTGLGLSADTLNKLLGLKAQQEQANRESNTSLFGAALGALGQYLGK